MLGLDTGLTAVQTTVLVVCTILILWTRWRSSGRQ